MVVPPIHTTSWIKVVPKILIVVQSRTVLSTPASGPIKVIAATEAPPIIMSVTAPFLIALVAGPPVVAPVAASPTSSSAFPASDLIFSAFLSLPLALLATAFRSFNTSASVIVPDVTFRHLRSCLACRDAEYAAPNNRFFSREVEFERLTAEVLASSEQVTLLCDRHAQQQGLLDSRADELTFLQHEHAVVWAHLLVSAHALVAKTQEYN